jgi:hypothetical protein
MATSCHTYLLVVTIHLLFSGYCRLDVIIIVIPSFTRTHLPIRCDLTRIASAAEFLVARRLSLSLSLSSAPSFVVKEGITSGVVASKQSQAQTAKKTLFVHFIRPLLRLDTFVLLQHLVCFA